MHTSNSPQAISPMHANKLRSNGTFRLAEVDRQVRGEESYARAGQVSRSLVPGAELQVSYVALKEGAKMRACRMDYACSIFVTSGFVRVELGNHTVELPSGQLLVVDPRKAHDVVALTDCGFVLTVRSSVNG